MPSLESASEPSSEAAVLSDHLVDAWLVGTVLEPVLKTLMSWYRNCTLQMKQIRKILNTILSVKHSISI